VSRVGCSVPLTRSYGWLRVLCLPDGISAAVAPQVWTCSMSMRAPLANGFLPAFVQTLEELADDHYFANRAGDTCALCSKPYFWTATRVKRALTARVGPINWPLLPGEGMPDERVVTYIEGFYQIVAEPREVAPGRACGISHAGFFDVAGGCSEYSVRVNALLERFATGLRLETGEVRSSGSSVMSPRLADELPYGGDEHLRKLAARAIEDFRSADSGTRWSALGHLANALERVKTTLDPSNKAMSAKMLVAAMSPDPALDGSIDTLLRAITDISNKATVRHHELGKAEITEDGDMIDFLFYQYYDVLRFALVRLDAERRRGQAAAAS
jgi:hypothetical protein